MDYATHLFDCDGVILASNAAKAKAFYDTVRGYGEEQARSLEAYHKVAGSIGREARFRWFFDTVLKREPEAGELEHLLGRCTKQILESNAEPIPGIEDYLKIISTKADCIVVSGIDSGELRQLLSRYDLTRYFKAIHGGPRLKGEILDALKPSIISPSILYGDAEEDYLCALQARAHFCLVKCDSFWREGSQLIQADPRAREINDFTELIPIPVGSEHVV